MSRVERIKKLAALVQSASERISDLSRENAKLRGQVDSLNAENGRLDELSKGSSAIGRRQERVRKQLERMAAKLDRALGALDAQR